MITYVQNVIGGIKKGLNPNKRFKPYKPKAI